MFGVQSHDSIIEPVFSQEVRDEVHENLLSSSDETNPQLVFLMLMMTQYSGRNL